MKLVLDASVVLKWFFRERVDEPDVAVALGLLRGIASGAIELLQPPHFVAEVSAVLAREAPEHAARDLRDLLDIAFVTRDDAAVYARAMRLAIDLDHHLFDTLYHAVAVETPGAVFVTADARYLAKTQGATQVCALANAASVVGAAQRGQ